jgi:phospholipid/cholesterol/gamma-HCH transport system substrate-binding protein
MDERVVKFRVGVMVVSTVFIIAILIVLFGKLPLWQQNYTVYVLFPEAPGVTRDTPVRKFGILIGRVSDIQFAEDDPRVADKMGAVVTLQIREEVRLRRSELCRLNSTLLGDAVLTFVPSAAEPDNEFIADGDVVQGMVASNPLQVLSNLEGGLTRGVDSLSGAGNEVATLARNINSLLMSNDEQIGRIVQKTEKSLDTFQLALASIDSVLGDEQIREDLKRSIAEAPRLMAQTRQAMGGLQEAVGLVNNNLRNLEGFTGPLGERGEGLITKVDDSVGRLDELLEQFVNFSRALNESEGTLGQLVNNPELYQRLNAAACNIENLTKELRPIVRDARVFSDKIARDPSVLGVRGALKERAPIK